VTADEYADQQQSRANNFWVQMTALLVVTVGIIALAAKYIW
jgi:hypothetical protein